MRKKLISRRDMIRMTMTLLCGGSLLPGCVPLGKNADSNESLFEISSEEPGPFSGHGVRSTDILGLEGIIRSDLRTSLGPSSGSGFFIGTATAAGLPVTLKLKARSISSGIAKPLKGLAIHLWQCDREGLYSMYSSKIITETYLRGVQVTGDEGEVTFETIFPGCHEGRMPHIHVEVFSDLESALSGGEPIKVTQLTFRRSLCYRVYQTPGYGISAANLVKMDFNRDPVFSDGVKSQMLSVIGNYTTNYQARIVLDLDELP